MGGIQSGGGKRGNRLEGDVRCCMAVKVSDTSRPVVGGPRCLSAAILHPGCCSPSSQPHTNLQTLSSPLSSLPLRLQSRPGMLPASSGQAGPFGPPAPEIFSVFFSLRDLCSAVGLKSQLRNNNSTNLSSHLESHCGPKQSQNDFSSISEEL